MNKRLIFTKQEKDIIVSLQSFSMTDKCKDTTKDTGIIYPLSKANNQASFSHIIDHNSLNKTMIKNSEYRLANNTVNGDIEYSQGRCITYVKSSTIEPSMVETLLGIKPNNISYVFTKDVKDISNEFIQFILNKLDNLDYQSQTKFILEENLKEKELIKDSCILKDNQSKDISLFDDCYFTEISIFKDRTELDTMKVKELSKYLTRLYEENLMECYDIYKLDNLIIKSKDELINNILKVQYFLLYIDNNFASDICLNELEFKDLSTNSKRKCIVDFIKETNEYLGINKQEPTILKTEYSYSDLLKLKQDFIDQLYIKDINVKNTTTKHK